ncbi:MAG: type I restriction enzyme HsdR N-terminal domain-containing protein, partial [Bacteroidota bacterium]
NRKAQPVLIVECKAPDVAVNQKVVDQIVRYNMELKVKFLIITNGMKHFGCYVDYENQSFRFLKSLPQFEQLQ